MLFCYNVAGPDFQVKKKFVTIHNLKQQMDTKKSAALPEKNASVNEKNIPSEKKKENAREKEKKNESEKDKNILPEKKNDKVSIFCLYLSYLILLTFFMI